MFEDLSERIQAKTEAFRCSLDGIIIGFEIDDQASITAYTLSLKEARDELHELLNESKEYVANVRTQKFEDHEAEILLLMRVQNVVELCATIQKIIESGDRTIQTLGGK